MPVVDYYSETPLTRLIRLQVRLAFVDGWAAVDPDAIDRQIRSLAEWRAELEAQQASEIVSERERTDIEEERRAVDRAVTWLTETHERARSRAYGTAG